MSNLWGRNDCLALALLFDGPSILNHFPGPQSLGSTCWLPVSTIDPMMWRLVGEDLPELPLSSLLDTLFLHPIVELTRCLAYLEPQAGLIHPPRLFGGEGDGGETWVLFWCYYPVPNIDLTVIISVEVCLCLCKTGHFLNLNISIEMKSSIRQSDKWHLWFYLLMPSSILGKW